MIGYQAAKAILPPACKEPCLSKSKARYWYYDF